MEASWKELLANPAFINAIKDTDVFIASHHGLESGLYSDLFDYFSPKLVVISDGSNVKTSATDKYSKIATGWKVYKRSEDEKTAHERKCLTTRNDRAIVIKVGKSTGNMYINVTTK